jgi:hypothetical protein
MASNLLIEQTVQLDSGLLIPASAATGKMLISDASGNASWIDPGDADLLQPGVVGNVASTGITATISSSTRVPTWSQWPTNDVIWFSVGGVMIRGTMPAGPTAAFDAPASGRWRYVAIDAVPPATFGGACTYVESSSADQTSAALAAGAATAVTAGNVRVWDGIITNTAGAYSLVSGGSGATLIPAATGRDRRPWARGALAIASGVTGSPTTTSTTAVLLTEMVVRVECTGVPIQVLFSADFTNSGADNYVQLSLIEDGTGVIGPARTNTSHIATQRFEAVLAWERVPAAGSHLYQIFWQTSAGTATQPGAARQMSVTEKLRVNANNGTA